MMSKLDEAKKKLNDMNEFIARLDPSIKEKAFDLLSPFCFGNGDHSGEGRGQQGDERSEPNCSDRSSFYSPLDTTKPDENVVHIAAWLYRQYGLVPISLKLVESESSSAGFIVPKRSDMTMRQKRVKKKKLFYRKGKGYALTTAGEEYVQATYRIKKGNTPLPAEKFE